MHALSANINVVSITESSAQCSARVTRKLLIKMSTEPITVTYRQAHGLDIKLDVYLPEASGSPPAVLFFHGGGLVSGNRRDLYFPVVVKGTVCRHSAFEGGP
jgi:acetyl esterase/lipase